VSAIAARNFIFSPSAVIPRRIWKAANVVKDSILESVRRSLQRLKTDRLDLLQLHNCSEAELRKGEVIDAPADSARKRLHQYTIG